MKRFTFIALALFIFSGALSAQVLPESGRKVLDRNFRGWKFAEVSGDIQKFLRERNTRNNSGNLISGDWNGDGRRDYAVLIDHGYITLNGGTKEPRRVSVALISSGRSFSYFVLDTFGDYIAFEKKGRTAYDYATDSPIKFSNDAVFVGIWEKAGTSYVWRKNKFIGFATSD